MSEHMNTQRLMRAKARRLVLKVLADRYPEEYARLFASAMVVLKAEAKR
jgi:hypothetical protein